MDERAACALNKLMEELDGWNFITAVSGWRSQEEQQEIYIRSLWENGEGESQYPAGSVQGRWQARFGVRCGRGGLQIGL